LKLTNQMVHDTIKEYRIINEIAGRYINVNYSIFGLMGPFSEDIINVRAILKKLNGLEVEIIENPGNLQVIITIEHEDI